MMPGQTTSTLITSRSLDLAANIWRNSARMSVVLLGMVNSLTVWPVFLDHSSVCFLQKSKS